MTQWLRRLSPRGEFLLVNAVCFALPLSSAVWIVFSHVRVLEMTDARVLRGIVIETLSITAALAILAARGWTAGNFGFRPTFRGTGAAVLLVIGYLFVVYLLYFAAAGIFYVTHLDATHLELFRFRQTAHVPLLLLFILINSFYEELFVTGYAIESLREHGPVYAVTVSAFIRFTYHVYQGPIAALTILVLGLILAAIYWQRRNLYPLMVAHTLINILAMVRSH